MKNTYFVTRMRRNEFIKIDGPCEIRISDVDGVAAKIVVCSNEKTKITKIDNFTDIKNLSLESKDSN
jgi:hypothetical protein